MGKYNIIYAVIYKQLHNINTYFRADSVEVILGAHNISNVEETQVRLNSSTFIIHNEYNPETHLNDIAIVKLPVKVNLTGKFIKKIISGKDFFL